MLFTRMNPKNFILLKQQNVWQALGPIKEASFYTFEAKIDPFSSESYFKPSILNTNGSNVAFIHNLKTQLLQCSKLRFQSFIFSFRSYICSLQNPDFKTENKFDGTRVKSAIQSSVEPYWSPYIQHEGHLTITFF